MGHLWRCPMIVRTVRDGYDGCPLTMQALIQAKLFCDPPHLALRRPRGGFTDNLSPDDYCHQKMERVVSLRRGEKSAT
jgi:hypothetical protein